MSSRQPPFDIDPAAGGRNAGQLIGVRQVEIAWPGGSRTIDDPFDWFAIDTSVLEENRASVPPFPLDVLAEPWRDWIADTAHAAGAPVDYVAQAVLAVVAGLCGAGAAVRVTAQWFEPLVLWQAVVGGPSSAKSPALASPRRLLATLEAENGAGEGEREGEGEQTPRLVVSDAGVEALAAAVAQCPRGVLLWRDAPSPWLGRLGRAGDHGAAWLQAWTAGPLVRADRSLERFPVSLLGTLAPDDLEAALPDAGDSVAARLLYAWPGVPPHHPLADCRSACDDEALNMLRRIARQARSPDDPLVLPVDAYGLNAFDNFLFGLQDELRHAEGLEAGWLGKGRGTVARLAGLLELLAWSSGDATGAPGALGRDQIEAAARLWSDYFRPHAHAVFDRAGPTDLERQVRRVVRWLKAGQRTQATREEVRRYALGKTTDAQRTDLVLGRLYACGILRPAAHQPSPEGGRPRQLWEVNPALGWSKARG
jgi:hypothetical protein